MFAFIHRINNNVALGMTLVFGSMWCAYAFLGWSLLPSIFPQTEQFVFYVSGGIVQLVALPLIMVGQNLTGQQTEHRAEEDHQMIMAQFEIIKTLQVEGLTLAQELHAMHDEVREQLVAMEKLSQRLATTERFLK